MFTNIINYFDNFHKSLQLYKPTHFLTCRQNLDIVKPSKLSTFSQIPSIVICIFSYIPLAIPLQQKMKKPVETAIILSGDNLFKSPMGTFFN
jgi:hypothetical protein